jgi:hypothetical protein
MRSGVGDLISNNMDYIRQTHDRSYWAYDRLAECFDLLIWGERWPYDIDEQIPDDRKCKTRLCSWIQKMRFKMAKWAYDEEEDWEGFHVKYRSQGDMTRDPYIYSLACAVDMGLFQFLPTISIPWYLYRGATWKWHKFIKNPTERRYKRWQRAEKRTLWFKVEDFADDLRQARLESGAIIYAQMSTEHTEESDEGFTKEDACRWVAYAFTGCIIIIVLMAFIERFSSTGNYIYIESDTTVTTTNY